MVRKMKKNYGFGIVGCGVIGDDHIQAVIKTEGIHLTAVCDANPVLLEQCCKKYNVKGYTALEDLLADDHVDVVTIATPSGTHADIGMKAARAGKHVITEKPIDITLEKADALISACRKNGVKLSCIFQNRYNRAAVQLKRAIEDGTLGKIHFGAGHVKWYRDAAYYRNSGWRGTWAMDGGGALINQSIHTIDLLLYLMGEVESVAGMCGAYTHPGIEVEDTGVAILRFCSGAVGILEGTTSCYPGYGTRIDICGDQGSVVVQDRVVSKWDLRSGEPYRPDLTLPERGNHAIQFLDMVRAIETGTEPEINGFEARRALEVVLAIYRSNQTGTVIKL